MIDINITNDLQHFDDNRVVLLCPVCNTSNLRLTGTTSLSLNLTCTLHNKSFPVNLEALSIIYILLAPLTSAAVCVKVLRRKATDDVWCLSGAKPVLA